MLELGGQMQRRLADVVARVDVRLRQKPLQVAARPALGRLVQDSVPAPLVASAAAAAAAVVQIRHPDPRVRVIRRRRPRSRILACLSLRPRRRELLLRITARVQRRKNERGKAGVLGHVADEGQRQLNARFAVAARVAIAGRLVVADQAQQEIRTPAFPAVLVGQRPADFPSSGGLVAAETVDPLAHQYRTRLQYRLP